MQPKASDVPADAGELVKQYRDLIRRLVIKRGVPAQDADDATQFILTRMIERNVLGMYDPSKGTFRNFVCAQASVYANGQRDKVLRKATRELLIADSPVDGEDGGTSWADTFGGLAACDDYSYIDAEEWVTRMRAHLASIPPRSLDDACDLVAVFDELLREIHVHGQYSRDELCARFSIGATTAAAWITRLREIMAGAGDGLPSVPVQHEVGGVVLTLADIRSAIKILREARGIMVRQPLAKAGHPLGSAPDVRWYHPFSKAERKAYPDAVEVDPQTHQAPADHVKRAVIHGLERMLGIALADEPAPVEAAPEPEATPVDEFEATMWRYIKDAQEMDRVLALARRAFAVSV